MEKLRLISHLFRLIGYGLLFTQDIVEGGHGAAGYGLLVLAAIGDVMPLLRHVSTSEPTDE